MIGLLWWLRWWNVCLQCRRPRFNPWVRKIPWRRKWQPTPVFLPGKFHEPRRLVGYSPWGHKESDMTEQLHFHFSRLWFSAKSTHSELLSAAAIHGPEEKEDTKRRWLVGPSIWWRCSVFCISCLLSFPDISKAISILLYSFPSLDIWSKQS